MVGGWGWPLRGGRGLGSGVAAVRLRGVLSPGERERARRPSRASFEPGGVYAGFAQFLRRGACPPEKKLLPCRFRARKSEGFQRKLCRGGSAGGASSPATSEPQALSCFNRTRRRVRRVRGNFFVGELASPGEEIASLRERTAGRAACRPTSERVHFRPSDAVTWAKRSGGGACSPATK